MSRFCYPFHSRVLNRFPLQPSVDQLEFNKTASCVAPLIATNNPSSWYDDVVGCGVQCRNPLFTDEEHDQVHTFIAVWGSVCLLCTLFAVVSVRNIRKNE